MGGTPDSSAGASRPGRRNGHARGQVAGIQRARMTAAMVDVAVERGLANATVAHVVARSGVSRRTFYEAFEDREDCFLATLEDAIDCAAGYVLPAYEEAAGGWSERMRAGVVALLSFLDDEPAMGRLIVVESLGAGPRALELRGRLIDQLIAAVDAGREAPKARRDVPPLTAEGLVGAVLAVIHARLTARRRQRMIELAGSLTGILVLPYLGPAAAARETARAAPKPRKRPRRRGGDPLRELDMRLTHRTVRVLAAIAARPGASNRDIGREAGVEDQGQISKLLARLARLGLVENTGEGHLAGAPNAWWLTDRGREVEASVARTREPRAS